MRARIIPPIAALLVAGVGYALVAQDKAGPAKTADAAEAGVKQVAAAFRKAFDAGDAKAVAALWTADAEYTGPDGETVRGRDAIEKMYAEVFKAHPKATAEAKSGSVRALGRRLAAAEGTLTVRAPNSPEPGETRYSALLVREDDGWKLASIREWLPDPALDVSPTDLQWLIGEWTAKGEGGDLRIRYTWSENKAFLRGKYTLTKGGKTTASGEQVIGKDPAGGLCAWVFDSSGAFGGSTWEREGGWWLSNAAATLPDGSEAAATNVLIPLGPDAFTWQSVGRTLNETPVPDSPPLKVTRVKTGK
jgi:uncharacterized protein (TIGR02246 family)